MLEYDSRCVVCFCAALALNVSYFLWLLSIFYHCFFLFDNLSVFSRSLVVSQAEMSCEIVLLSMFQYINSIAAKSVAVGMAHSQRHCFFAYFISPGFLSLMLFESLSTWRINGVTGTGLVCCVLLFFIPLFRGVRAFETESYLKRINLDCNEKIVFFSRTIFTYLKTTVAQLHQKAFKYNFTVMEKKEGKCSMKNCSDIKIYINGGRYTLYFLWVMWVNDKRPMCIRKKQTSYCRSLFLVHF